MQEAGAGRQVVPLFRSCAGRAANHPRLAVPLSWARISSRSSNHHYEMPFQLLPLRPKHAPPSFSSLTTLMHLSASGLCSHRATQYFEVSVAEVVIYTVPARPMRLLDFLDLQAPCPVAPLSSPAASATRQGVNLGSTIFSSPSCNLLPMQICSLRGPSQHPR